MEPDAEPLPVGDVESVLSLDDDREPVPEKYKLLAKTYDSKITYELLTEMKKVYKKVSSGEYSAKEDFLYALQKKITVGEGKLTIRNTKDTLAIYLAHVKKNTLRCEFCTISNKEFISYNGLVRHLTTKHYAELDSLQVHDGDVAIVRKAIANIRLEMRGKDYPLVENEIKNHFHATPIAKVIVPVPVPVTNTLDVVTSTETNQAVNQLMSETFPEVDFATSHSNNNSEYFMTYAATLEEENQYFNSTVSNVTVSYTLPFDCNSQSSQNSTHSTINSNSEYEVVLQKPPLFKNCHHNLNNVGEYLIYNEDEQNKRLDELEKNTLDDQLEQIINGTLGDDHTVALTTNVPPVQYSEVVMPTLNDVVVEHSVPMDIQAATASTTPKENINNFMSSIKLKELSNLVATIPDVADTTPKKRKTPTAKTPTNLIPTNINKAMVGLNPKKICSKEYITTDDSEDEPPSKIIKSVSTSRPSTSAAVAVAVATAAVTKQKRVYTKRRPKNAAANPTGTKSAKPAVTKSGKPKGLPRKRGPRTATETYKINDALKFGAKKTGPASDKEVLENMPWILRLEEEMEVDINNRKKLETKYKVPGMDQLYQQDIAPNTTKEIKANLRKFINENGISNKNQPSSLSDKKKVNNLKINPDSTQPLAEFARNTVNFECFSKNNNSFGNDYTTWFDSYLNYHSTNLDAATRKKKREEAIQQTHPSQDWKLSLQRLAAYEPFRSETAKNLMSFFDNDECLLEPIVKRINVDLGILLNPENKTPHSDIKSVAGKLLKCKLLGTFKMSTSMYTKKDEAAYRRWMNSVKTHRKNINLTPKFKSFMSRMVSVMQNPTCPLNQFTRLSNTALRKSFNGIVHTYIDALNMENYNTEGKKVIYKMLDFTDTFYDNLMVMMMKFAYARYSHIWFMSKVTKRNAGAGLVEAGIVDTMTRTNLGELSPFLHSQFESFYTSERISKTLSQLHIMSFKSCKLESMDDVRTALENRNPELLELVNIKCTEVIYPIIRNNMFNLLCNLANNIVDTYCQAGITKTVSWDLFKDVLFRSKYYEYAGPASQALSFEPILDRSISKEYWGSMSDKTKVNLFTYAFLKIPEGTDSDELVGVETIQQNNDVETAPQNDADDDEMNEVAASPQNNNDDDDDGNATDCSSSSGSSSSDSSNGSDHDDD